MRIWQSLFLAACVAACSAAPQTAAENAARLASPSPTRPPYRTRTFTPPPPPPDPFTPTPLPSPTPEPLIHTVKGGEDMGGIAYRYGITLEALRAANPEVNPNLMSVGQRLVIPAAQGGRQGGEQGGSLPAPTPLAARLGTAHCAGSLQAGTWCFAEVSNPLETDVENVIVLFRAAVQGSGEIFSVYAPAPLNLLRAGQRMGVAAFFPGPLEGALGASVELASALPAAAGRYPATRVEDLNVEISPGGLGARVSGRITLEDAAQGAGRVWAAVTAYAADGRVVGVRRWESPASLGPGERLPFNFMVYSSGGALNTVEISVEAQ